MSKKEYLLRYISIIKKLRRSKEATFNEINDSLKEVSIESGYDLTISKRTFHRDIKEISMLFSIDIQYNFSKGAYYIDEDFKGNIGNRILESFDMINSLNEKIDLSKFVSFEKRRSSGIEHFYDLIQAIKNNLVIDLTHNVSWTETKTNTTIEPYSLKEFQNRWYLVAKDLEDNKIKTFGLDSIVSMIISKESFEYPKYFDPDMFFEHTYGTEYSEQEPELLCLTFTPETGKYIKTFPLHASQVCLEEKDDKYEFLYNIKITDDLIMKLLSYGDKLLVEIPNHLQNHILQIGKNMVNNYSKL